MLCLPLLSRWAVAGSGREGLGLLLVIMIHAVSIHSLNICRILTMCQKMQW